MPWSLHNVDNQGITHIAFLLAMNHPDRGMIGVLFCCYCHGLDPAKVRKISLLCYFTYSQGKRGQIHVLSNGVLAKMNATDYLEFELGLLILLSTPISFTQVTHKRKRNVVKIFFQ